MSKCDELKNYKVYTTRSEGAWGYHYEPNPNKDQSDIELNDEQVYLKKDVDKVIAEKDKQLRHQKYKRCLAMAKYCYSMDCRMLNEASDNGTYFKESWCWKRASWYGKWKRKWLELAEKFKPNNSTAQ